MHILCRKLQDAEVKSLFPLPQVLHFVLRFTYLTAARKAGIHMSDSNAFSHLALDEICIILTGITNGSTKTTIAQTIDKDKSAVGKKIKLHRVLTHKCPFERRRPPGLP